MHDVTQDVLAHHTYEKKGNTNMVSMSKLLLLLNTFVYAVRIVFLVMLKFEMRSMPQISERKKGYFKTHQKSQQM